MKRTLQILILFFVWILNAQVYPVQVNTQLLPPYNLKLSDYATAMSERFMVQIQMLDVTDMNRQLGFRLSIRGNGFNIRSNEFVIGAAPVYIDGGNIIRLTNLDLRPYFELQNLSGINPQQYNEPLPDGHYQFCMEVYDWISGRQLSNPNLGCFNAFLLINEPPILNLPRNGDVVEAKDPQNIIFNWTPRHLNASGVQYEFELREIWDTQIDPRAAFQASPNLFRTITGSNTLLYGPAETPLLENRIYAWQVRALVTDGISETSVFRNNGYSEIYYFNYTAECASPQFALAKSLSADSEEVSWQPDTEQTTYRVQYRKKGVQDAVWFESNAVNPHTILYNLEPGTTYEFRVGRLCVQLSGYNEVQFSYNEIQEFTTPLKNEDSYYNCGLAPKIEITNRDDLTNLVVNEVFTAGDFPVTVKEVKESKGKFSGKGYIKVPYLADTKIAVEFKNIRINTDYQLYDGKILTVYNPTWSNIEDAADEIAAIAQIPETIGNLVEELKELLQNWIGSPEQIEALEEKKLELTEQLEAAIGDVNISESLKEEMEISKKGLTDTMDNLVEKGAEATEDDIQEVDNALEKVADDLNVYEQNRNIEYDKQKSIAGDDYFDGVINFSLANEKQIRKPDDPNPLLSLTDPQQKSDNESYLNVTSVLGLKTNKGLIVSESRNIDIDNSEEIKKIKDEIINIGSDEYLLWIHYDYGKNEVMYKVAYGSNYFKGTALARDDLIDLYNTLLSYNYEGGAGSAIVTATEALDLLMDEYEDLTSSASEEMVSELSTFQIIKMAISFARNCMNNPEAAPGGIVPKCLWDQNIDPAVAYQAGFIDAAWEVIPVAVEAGKFIYAWQPLNNSYYWTPEAMQIRKLTIDALLLIQKLDKEETFLATIKEHILNELSNYADETLDLDAQARYNQGKLIFEVASFFFGVGEVKAALKTGRITSASLEILKSMPSQITKLFSILPGKLKKLQGNVLAYIVSANMYIEIARFGDDGVLLIDKWIDEPIEIVENLGEVAYRLTDASAAKIAELQLVKDKNGIFGFRVRDAGDDIFSLFEKQKNRLQDLKTQYGELDFNDFTPVRGKTLEDLSLSMYNEMFFELRNRSSWIKQQKVNKLIELIESGSTIPKKVIYQKGTELFKVVKKGVKPSEFTEYWLTKAELDDLMRKGSDIESRTGLPLGSMAIEYDIYKITANQSATTYSSVIASTIQRGYTTTGGATQTLVLDRSLWSTPVKYNTQSFIPDL